jgi:hypothetical protein
MIIISPSCLRGSLNVPGAAHTAEDQEKCILSSFLNEFMFRGFHSSHFSTHFSCQFLFILLPNLQKVAEKYIKKVLKSTQKWVLWTTLIYKLYIYYSCCIRRRTIKQAGTTYLTLTLYYVTCNREIWTAKKKSVVKKNICNSKKTYLWAWMMNGHRLSICFGHIWCRTNKVSGSGGCWQSQDCQLGFVSIRIGPNKHW